VAELAWGKPLDGRDPLPDELVGVVNRCLSKTAPERPAVEEVLDEFARHRERTPHPHDVASWLPVKAIAVIDSFAISPISAASTTPLRPVDKTQPMGSTSAQRTHVAAAHKSTCAVAAGDLYADLVRDRTRVLGPDHSDTLRTRSQYAHYVGQVG
jgi:hypothetical protein